MRLHQIKRHINMLIPQRICANSNSTCPPQRGMQPLGIETTPWHLTPLNSFLFSFAFSTPWQLAQWNCILFHSTTNLHTKCFNLIQPWAYNHKTFLLQWQKKNCHQLSHQTPWNLWLIHVNLKRTRKNFWDDKKIVGMS